MTMTYQEQQMLQAATGRAAILDLNARHNRAYSDGDRDRWIATFRHSGASYTRDGELFTDLRSAFDGGDGQRLVTVDHEIQRRRGQRDSALCRSAFRRHVWRHHAAGHRDIPGRS